MSLDIDNRPILWYQTWWGVVLIGVLSLVLVVVLGFSGIVGFYFWKIKNGQGDEIVARLAEIKKDNAQSPALNEKRKELETTDDPYLGNPKAEIVIVQFVDFKCPNSALADPIMRQVSQKYWNKVKIIVRDFPVESLYKGATDLAKLTSCANEQGKYWGLNDLLFQMQSTLPEKLTEEQAKSLLNQAGVNFAEAKKCLGTNKVSTEINKDYTDGYRNGVEGTPTFFINGEKVQGVISLEAWDKFLGGL